MSKIHTSVKSRYRARWKGIILDYKNRTAQPRLLLILVVKDSLGNMPRKRILHIMSEAWVVEIPDLDITDVPGDWFNKLPYKL